MYPTHSKEGKRPAKFEGVFQGKPHGKGIHTLVNGEEVGPSAQMVHASLIGQRFAVR